MAFQRRQISATQRIILGLAVRTRWIQKETTSPRKRKFASAFRLPFPPESSLATIFNMLTKVSSAPVLLSLLSTTFTANAAAVPVRDQPQSSITRLTPSTCYDPLPPPSPPNPNNPPSAPGLPQCLSLLADLRKTFVGNDVLSFGAANPKAMFPWTPGADLGYECTITVTPATKKPELVKDERFNPLDLLDLLVDADKACQDNSPVHFAGARFTFKGTGGEGNTLKVEMNQGPKTVLPVASS